MPWPVSRFPEVQANLLVATYRFIRFFVRPFLRADSSRRWRKRPVASQYLQSKLRYVRAWPRGIFCDSGLADQLGFIPVRTWLRGFFC